MSRPILIIGGGLGGLCLAQALKKHNIHFKLFEKDAEIDFRPQGYRLRVMEHGIYALQYALTPELYTLFEQTCAAAIAFGVQVKADGSLVDDTTRIGPPPLKGPKPYTVDRTTFRKVLLTGLKDDVFFGKALDHYTLHNDGVSAHFTDGSVEHGALLVGADGVGSRVRKQLIPGFKVIDTGMRSLYGKTPMTPEFLERFPQEYQRGMNIVIDERVPGQQKTMLFEATWFPNLDGVSEPELPSPYVYWVLGAHSSTIQVPDEKFLYLDNEEAADLAVELTKDWSPGLRAIFDMQGAGQTSTLRISSAPLEIPAWGVSPRVTLLGDAIHVMPPTGAMGLVTALRDSAELARKIVEAGGVDKVDPKVIGSYESEMREFAKMAVGKSWQGGLKTFGLRPVEECEMVDL
ncbi:hypothetical protein ETB97_002207 [Aspergillus alliaceus]|uniref:FAD-binding domain-containing protein n=1 Tax=Petromyces alliaceus TaxID=209559 RepID=A0A5N7CBW1_PETAA|nr:hypothetical protein BDV23DRAFT_153057 [Aspergillus alliaceus]KAF5859947.1 hypothetical protein ETB97_002207 [Aspergillus burnettii]